MDSQLNPLHWTRNKK